MEYLGKNIRSIYLVAWEKFCSMKENGGLGIKRLDT